MARSGSAPQLVQRMTSFGLASLAQASVGMDDAGSMRYLIKSTGRPPESTLACSPSKVPLSIQDGTGGWAVMESVCVSGGEAAGSLILTQTFARVPQLRRPFAGYVDSSNSICVRAPVSAEVKYTSGFGVYWIPAGSVAGKLAIGAALILPSGMPLTEVVSSR